MKVELELSGNNFLALLREIKTQSSRAKIANRAKFKPEPDAPDGEYELYTDSVSQVVQEGK